MVLNLQSHSATSLERAASFAKARFGCKTHFEHEFILHFEYMIHALFVFPVLLIVQSLCENPQSGANRPEPAPVKSSRKSANEFGVKGYPLAPTIDGKLAFCQWCNGVWNYRLPIVRWKERILCQLELLRMWTAVWARVSLRGSQGILRIIAGNSILTTLILILRWITFFRESQPERNLSDGFRRFNWRVHFYAKAQG